MYLSVSINNIYLSHACNSFIDTVVEFEGNARSCESKTIAVYVFTILLHTLHILIAVLHKAIYTARHDIKMVEEGRVQLQFLVYRI